MWAEMAGTITWKQLDPKSGNKSHVRKGKAVWLKERPPPHHLQVPLRSPHRPGPFLGFLYNPANHLQIPPRAFSPLALGNVTYSPTNTPQPGVTGDPWLWNFIDCHNLVLSPLLSVTSPWKPWNLLHVPINMEKLWIIILWSISRDLCWTL